MTQYIDKAALIAEIERMKVDAIQFPFEEYGTVGTCNKLLSFLDTLEVKEINSTDAFIRKARKYFYKELPNFRSFMESGTSFIKNFESFIRGE